MPFLLYSMFKRYLLLLLIFYTCYPHIMTGEQLKTMVTQGKEAFAG